MITQLVVCWTIIISKAITIPFDGDPKTIQQFNFTENLDRPASTTMLFII